jgi:hypothetical protein
VRVCLRVGKGMPWLCQNMNMLKQNMVKKKNKSMPYRRTTLILCRREKDVKYKVCERCPEISKSSDSSSKRRRDHISKLVNTVNVGCPDHNICIATCGTSEDDVIIGNP